MVNSPPAPVLSRRPNCPAFCADCGPRSWPATCTTSFWKVVQMASTKVFLNGVLAALIVGLAGCAAETDDEEPEFADGELGFGDSALRNQVESLLKAGKDPCKVLKPTIRDNNGDRKFIGTNGADVIFGTNGKDFIDGKGGNDVICGLGGDDMIYGGYGEDYIDGGDGNDYIEGGGNNDEIHGGAGNDVIHGRGGSDDIYGGPGDDYLDGDILDDHIFGEGGNDILIGGHGVDLLNGGDGNDFLRGDTNGETFIGGPGHDIVSFATALPPGAGAGPGVDGVFVNFKGECLGKHQGCAEGDGSDETLDSVEEVIGSPFSDKFVGDERDVLIHGSYGKDTYVAAGGNIADDTQGETPSGFVYIEQTESKQPMYFNQRVVDRGLVVLGSKKDDMLVVNGTEEYVDVDSRVPSPRGDIKAGPGCTQRGPRSVRCPSKALRFIAAYLDDGNDRFDIKGKFHRELTAHASGGEGDDVMVGGDEQDVFFTGPSGRDKLVGNGGDDALLSESHHTGKKDGKGREAKAMASEYKDGADQLFGGDGDDQFVADYPCGGHEFHGGKGLDIAGFARSGSHGIHAQLGGKAEYHSPYWGLAANLELCPDFKKHGTKLDGGLEVLEGADGPDFLMGDDGYNWIWGRGGGDRLYGLGGDDLIRGADGNDVIDGGSGNNRIVLGKDEN